MKNSMINYQKIYEEADWYGNANIDRCPGNRLFPYYKSWIKSPILDLGCGRGHTVEILRQKGFECDGIDQININPDMMVGDITRPLTLNKKYECCLSMDVIEHIPDSILQGLFDNFKLFNYQIFSIHNGSSIYNGEELHINKKTFDDWRILISKQFNIINEVKIHEQQVLYYTVVDNNKNFI